MMAVPGKSPITFSSTDETAHVFLEKEERVSIIAVPLGPCFLILDMSGKKVRIKEGISFMRVHITGRLATIVIGGKEITLSHKKGRKKTPGKEGGKKEGALLLLSLVLIAGALISFGSSLSGGVKPERVDRSPNPIIDSGGGGIIPVSILHVRDLLGTQKIRPGDELTSILPSLLLQRKLAEKRGDLETYRSMSALIGTIHNQLNHR